MKLNLLLVAAVILAALAASLLMVPRTSEQALMLLRSGDLEGARALLEQNLSAGRLEAATIRPLVDVSLANGEPERAIDALALFVARHPDDPKALRLLADLQRQVNRFDAYAATLAALYAATGEAATLRDYADLAVFRDDRAARRWALGELARIGRAEPEEYVELARYMGHDGRPAAGLDALDGLAKAWPRDVDETFIDLYTALASAADANQRMQAMLLDWLRSGTDTDADSVQALLAGVARRLGPAAARAVIAAADRDPQLAARHAEAFAAAEAETGQPDAALARLAARDTLSAAGRRLLFGLALDAGRFDLAATTLESLPDSRLADLVALLDALPEDRRAAFGSRLRDRIGTEQMAARPLLAARLALAVNDRAAARQWLAQVAVDGLDFADRLFLAQVLLQLDEHERGLGLLAALAGDPRLPPDSFGDLAQAYLRLGRQAEGAALLASLRQARPGIAMLDAAWARLATASGDAAAVAGWLAQAAPRDPALLTDLYYLAGDRAQWPLALAAATRLAALQPFPDHAVMRARALLALNRPAEALPLLAGLPAGTPDAALLALDAARQSGADATAAAAAALAQPAQTAQERRDIIGALTDPQMKLSGTTAAIVAAVEADLDAGGLGADELQARLELLARLAPRRALPRWQAAAAAGSRAIGDGYLDLLARLGRRDDAVTFLAGRMQRGAGRKEAEADLYALLDIGGAQRALPYLKQAAERWGGSWRPAYEEALEKLGRRDELLALLAAVAGDAKRPAAERRDAAFRLLDLGDRAPAEAAFRQLAGREGPDGENTRQLLYLWGPRPRRDGLDWLEARARAARGEAQLQWLQLLQEHGGGERMAALLGSSDDLLDQPRRLDLLVGYLAERRRLREAEDWLLRAGQAAGRDGARLAALLDRAEEFGLTRAVAELARAMAAADPNDREALRRLARAAFDAGRRSEALALYRRYHDSGPGSWQSHYNYGELLLSGQKRSEAAQQYRQALAIIDRQLRPGAEAARARPFLLGRLGRLDEMDQAMAALLKARPGDTDLRTDLAGLLIDLGRLDEAERIINP